jgi:hypothetical protein
VIDQLMDRILAGRPVGTRFRQLGVRWVVLAHEDDWVRYAGLYDDAGLQLVLQDRAVDLFAVRPGSSHDQALERAAEGFRRPIPPLIRTSAAPGTVLDLAGAPGWLRGWGHAARTTADGRLVMPPGQGFLWFWPAVSLLLIDLVTLIALVACARSVRHDPEILVTPLLNKGAVPPT